MLKFFLSVTFIAYGLEVGINIMAVFKYLFQNMILIPHLYPIFFSHEKPILQVVYKARDWLLGACVTNRL